MLILDPIVFVLNCVFYGIAFFLLMLILYILKILFLYMCKLYIVRSCSFGFVVLCLLMGIVRPCFIDVIITVVGFKCAILLFVILFFPYFAFSTLFWIV